MKKLVPRKEISLIALKYLKERKREFTEIQDSDRFVFESNYTLIFGSKKHQTKDIYSVKYGEPWGLDDVAFFIIIDAYTGEVYYTITPHGFAEEYE